MLEYKKTIKKKTPGDLEKPSQKWRHAEGQWWWERRKGKVVGEISKVVLMTERGGMETKTDGQRSQR